MASYTSKCAVRILAAIASVVLVIGLLPTVALADTLEAPGESAPDASPAAIEESAGQNDASNPKPEGEGAPESRLLSTQGEELGCEGGLMTAASTEDQCGENLTWKLENGTLTISGTGDMYDYNFEDTAPWYGSKDIITSVVIGNGVTSIGQNAFSDCANLADVTIPSGVTDIGVRAFDQCSKLKSATIPGSVANISFRAFYGCTSLADVTIMEGVEYIAGLAFMGCESLASITVPGSVRQIDYAAFSTCKSLASVTLMDGVETISKDAFGNCFSIREITVPASVEEIGDYAFLGAFSNSADVYYGGTEKQFRSHLIPGESDYKGFNQLVMDPDTRLHYECHAVRVHVSPATGGKVEGADTYANGAMAELKAIPYEGYEFVNWTEGGTVVSNKAAWEFVATDDRALVAHFALKKYKVTFVDADGTVLKAATEYDYGTKAADIEKPSDPTKKADAQYTYTFKEWTPAVVGVTSDATYKATYDKALNKYEVTFVNEDGTVLQSGEVEYGKTPAYTGKTPTKAADEKYVYEFTGWTPEIVAATGDATYKATYKAVEKYPCAEGSNQTWTKGSADPLSLRFKGATDDKATFDLFKGVEVDGKAVPEKDSSGNANWTASKGSLILSLQPSYLEALGDGNHTVKALFEDGAGEASFTIAAKATPAADTTRPASSDTAKTGDALPVTPVIATLLLSTCALIISRRKLQVVHPAYRGKHVR